MLERRDKPGSDSSQGPGVGTPTSAFSTDHPSTLSATQGKSDPESRRGHVTVIVLTKQEDPEGRRR